MGSAAKPVHAAEIEQGFHDGCQSGIERPAASCAHSGGCREGHKLGALLQLHGSFTHTRIKFWHSCLATRSTPCFQAFAHISGNLFCKIANQQCVSRWDSFVCVCDHVIYAFMYSYQNILSHWLFYLCVCTVPLASLATSPASASAETEQHHHLV